MNIQDFLRFAVGQGASDVHLQGGTSPKLRIAGQLRNVEGNSVEAASLSSFLNAVIPGGPEALARARETGSRLTFELPGLARFRAAFYDQDGSPGVSLRVIPLTPPDLDSLRLPPVLRELAVARRGLTLVVGASGSGRSTTLAALVDQVNKTRSAVVVTIEAPTEFVHKPDKSLFIHLDPGSEPGATALAIDRSLGLDPDVVVVGELDRTEEALRAVLSAVESGRHVLASFRASSSIRAIEQLLEPVSLERRAAVKLRLAPALEAIIGLRLAATKEGNRRPAVEVFRGVHQTRELYLANRLDDIARLMAGRMSGMQEFDRELLELYRSGQISGTEALRLATDPEALGADLQVARRPSA